MLNQLFAEQGLTGKPGRITPATVAHGERTRAHTNPNLSSSRRKDPVDRWELVCSLWDELDAERILAAPRLRPSMRCSTSRASARSTICDS
jgi:hypothetical protein